MDLPPVSTEKTIKRGRGRPKGAKDSFPRTRRPKFSLQTTPGIEASRLEDESEFKHLADPHQTSCIDDDANNNATAEDVTGDDQAATVKVGIKRARTDVGRKKDQSAQQTRRKKMKETDILALIDEENALRDPKWLKSTVQGFSLPLFRSLNYAEGSLKRGFLKQNQSTHAELTRTAILQMHRMIIEMSRPPREDVNIEPGQVEDVLRELVTVLHRRFSKTGPSSSSMATTEPLNNNDEKDDEEILDLVDEGEARDANDEGMI